MVISELLEAIFFRKIDEITQKFKECSTLYYPHDAKNYIKAIDQYIRDSISTKENFLSMVEDYHQHGKPIWQQQANQWCDPLYSEKLNSVFKNASQQHGKERVEMLKKMKEKWAFHLDEYASWINSNDSLDILELGTGAGMGTWSVMTTLQEHSRMISIDVDFEATRNADGLARYLDCEHRVCGLNANFWNLPCENELFDVVCTHHGLDESGEIQQTLSEIARVLKAKGKFVGVARKRPFVRHEKVFTMFDISEDEGNVLLNELRLYSGVEKLEEVARVYGLKLEKCKEVNHERILFCFVKE